MAAVKPTVGRISQDQTIAPQVTLWNQQGSQVIWGTMMVFAVPGNLALFIATFLREPWRYTLTVARVGALFHTAGMLLLSCLAAMRGTVVPFEFLIVQLLYDFFLLGLVWSEANVLAGLTAMGIEHGVFVGTSRGGLIVHLIAAMRPTALKGVVLNDVDFERERGYDRTYAGYGRGYAYYG